MFTICVLGHEFGTADPLTIHIVVAPPIKQGLLMVVADPLTMDMSLVPLIR